MPHRSQKVLVIEDDPQVLQMMQLVLQRSHLAVTTAATGEEGLALAETEDFDLITLDIDLPGLNGFEVCKALKRHERTRHIPVTFVSAHFWSEAMERAHEAGGADFLCKPFTAQALTEMVKEHLPPRHN